MVVLRFSPVQREDKNSEDLGDFVKQFRNFFRAAFCFLSRFRKLSDLVSDFANGIRCGGSKVDRYTGNHLHVLIPNREQPLHSEYIFDSRKLGLIRNTQHGLRDEPQQSRKTGQIGLQGEDRICTSVAIH